VTCFLKLFFFSTFFLAAGWCFSLPQAAADISYDWITHSELQSVTAYGKSQWAADHPSTVNGVSMLYPVRLIGLVVNDPADMLNSSGTASSPQWQVYVQAISSGGTYSCGSTTYPVASGDFGGTALWLAKTYYTGQSYGDGWTSLLSNYDVHYGDVVLIQAQSPGLFYNGKFNVNTQHTTLSERSFSITVIGHSTPTYATITLADLTTESSTNGCIFDSTKATGCEHYQGSLIHLDHLQLVDAAKWVAGGTATVMQTVTTADGAAKTLYFDLKLGLDEDLFTTAVKTAISNGAMFNMTAILDQESGDYMNGYRLWLTNADDLTIVPEPGTFALLAVAAGCGLAIRRGRRRRRQ
jgi:hypothetical protein